jgi:hypothetical protein
LVPEKDTNGLTNNKCNEPVPVEEVQDESRDYANARYKEELVKHGRRAERVQNAAQIFYSALFPKIA